MELWVRGAIAAGVVVVALAAAHLVDRMLTRTSLPPEVMTRYRVFRRAIEATIVTVGVFSALLVIPQVRALAGGLLASSALLAIMVGFAAQRTLGNFVAGILIALSQPVRIGDEVEVGGRRGIVEEIGLTYTFIRADDETRVVIPNEKLASDTIENATIRARRLRASVTVQVPVGSDLGALVETLREEAGVGADVRIEDIAGSVTLLVSVPAANAEAARLLESDLRLRIHERLRTEGVLA